MHALALPDSVYPMGVYCPSGFSFPVLNQGGPAVLQGPGQLAPWLRPWRRRVPGGGRWRGGFPEEGGGHLQWSLAGDSCTKVQVRYPPGWPLLCGGARSPVLGSWAPTSPRAAAVSQQPPGAEP